MESESEFVAVAVLGLLCFGGSSVFLWVGSVTVFLNCLNFELSSVVRLFFRLCLRPVLHVLYWQPLCHHVPTEVSMSQARSSPRKRACTTPAFTCSGLLQAAALLRHTTGQQPFFGFCKLVRAGASIRLTECIGESHGDREIS